MHGDNLHRFRGGLVFKAHRRLYHSTLGSRVIKKKEPSGSPLAFKIRRRSVLRLTHLMVQSQITLALRLSLTPLPKSNMRETMGTAFAFVKMMCVWCCNLWWVGSRSWGEWSGKTHLSDTMYSSISLTMSTPPPNRQLNILISNSKQHVDGFVGEWTF